MEHYVYCFTGRLIICVDDIYHEVTLFTEDAKLILDRGYIRENFVYFYKGDKETNKPGEFYSLNGKLIFNELEDIHSPHFIGNILELDNLDNIYRDVEENPDKFTSVKDIEIINTNGEIYTPTINEEDDFLKYIIKKAILSKQINLKNYRDKCKSLYDLNNLKSGLVGSTKMTVPYFLKWAEILGLDWELTIKDDGTDYISPLRNKITVGSRVPREE